MGACLSALERSSTFHVFADLLSAAARLLGPLLSEVTRMRLDVGAVGTAVYVAPHALAGAALGLVLGRTRLGTSAAATSRVVVLAGVLAAADGLVLGAVWRHRLLPSALGWAFVAAAALPSALVALLGGRLAARLAPGTRRTLAVALPGTVVAVSAVLAAAASRGPARPEGVLVTDPRRVTPASRVAILAVDGLDGRLVDEAVARGRLPHLRSLLDRGVRGDLRSIRPPKSPVVWTSAVTGVLPRRHGILDFVVRRDGERIPVTSNLRRVPALWNLAEAAGFTAGFVNWYVTWPAERVAGVVVSDRADFDGLPERVWPEDLTAAIDSARGRVDGRAERDIARFLDGPGDLAGFRAASWGQVRRSLDILDDVVRHDLVTLASAEVLFAGGQPDLTALYFRGTDNTQHLFWKHRLARRAGAGFATWMYGGLDSAEVRMLAPVIDRYYDFADELIGRVLARLADDTAVLVVSDHGFLANNERSRWFATNRLLSRIGLATLARGAGGTADAAASVVLDPEPPSIDARRVLRAGGSAPSAEVALASAREALVALRTDRGEALFRSTALGADDSGPWLAVVFEARLRGETVRDVGDLELAEFLQPEGHSGDHRMDGFLLAAGPPFRRGRIEGARAIDLAPTVLHLLGAPAARDQEGVVLTDLLDPGWSAAHPVRYVATYGARAETEEGAIATQADERIREELRALGYIR
jgi:predicted AlkP superfamily phosphohydrolase/phosphomutase